MALVEQSQLIVTRSQAGVWSIRPRSGRNYRTPVVPKSYRPVYGSNTLDLEFSGYRSASQRYQVTLGVINARGMDEMDGHLTSLVDECDTLKRFIIRWPQLANTSNGVATATVNTLANIGAGSLMFRSGTTAPRVGRLIQFEQYGKLYRVQFAPSGAQSAAYSVGVYPNLIKAVPANATVNNDVDGYVRLVQSPAITMSNGILYEMTMFVREALRA